MASGNEIHDSEITATNHMFSAVVTLTSSPPLPTLPEDVISEILCRLSVKLLLQLRCVCKSWNSLISDSEFIKKHLRMSTTRHLHFLSYYYYRPRNKYILISYPLDSVFTDDLNTDLTQLEYSPNNFNRDYPWTCFYHFIGSCNGILCFADDETGLVVWNPSIRKFKELPLFIQPNEFIDMYMTFGFGYDSSTDKYKVVVVLDYFMLDSQNNWVKNIEVKVHTLGTDIWRTVSGYPFDGILVLSGRSPFDGVPVLSGKSGKFVSGTINWLVSNEISGGLPHFIVSFDLVNESYRKILPRIGGKDICDLCSIGVLRDCLCVTSGNDVWIMEEYGNNESWTKLFTVSYMREPGNSYVATVPIYIFEDDQVILNFIGYNDLNLALYDSKSGTLKPTLMPTSFPTIPEVCVESLILPWSLC